VELVHTFTLPVPVADAWTVMTDLERLAACLPGASLDEQGEDWATGRVKVKLGALTMEFRGKATFVERDQDAGRYTVQAAGRDVSGQSSADASISVSMQPASSSDGTEVEVRTQLRTVGRAAQFGQSMIQDVSAMILRKFLVSLEASIVDTASARPAGQAGAGAAAPDASPAAAPVARVAAGAPSDDVLDIGGITGPLMLEKAKLPVLAGLVGLLLGWLLRSGSRGGRGGTVCCCHLHLRQLPER
jgi:carbon monoxide dehydrogenase subunit G